MHRRVCNPYRRISRGILIPPFTALMSLGEELSPSWQKLVNAVDLRYPIVFCDLAFTPLLLLPRVGFVPQTVGLRVLKPVFLCNRLEINYDNLTVRYDALNSLEGLDRCSGYTIATQRLALAEIRYVKQYRTRHYGIPYIAVSGLRVGSRLSPDSLRFLQNLKPGSSTRYRGLHIEVDAQAENLDDALDAVGYSKAHTMTSIEARITTVILYARNSLFMNASQPVPLSPNGRYTVARIGCREWYSALLLVVDWDDDLFSVYENHAALFDLLSLRRVVRYDNL